MVAEKPAGTLSGCCLPKVLSPIDEENESFRSPYTSDGKDDGIAIVCGGPRASSAKNGVSILAPREAPLTVVPVPSAPHFSMRRKSWPVNTRSPWP